MTLSCANGERGGRVGYSSKDIADAEGITGPTVVLAEAPGTPGDNADPALRRQWTYSELYVEAQRTARALLSRFKPGERVAVWAQNLPEWVMLEFGAGLAGRGLVTVKPGLRAKEVEYVLTRSRPGGGARWPPSPRRTGRACCSAVS